MASAQENSKWDSYNGASPLIALYNSFHPLTAEMEALIDSLTFPVSFRKNRYIISPIDRNRYLYLILKGVVRGFYKDSGTEITSWICQLAALLASGEIRSHVSKTFPLEDAANAHREMELDNAQGKIVLTVNG